MRKLGKDVCKSKENYGIKSQVVSLWKVLTASLFTLLSLFKRYTKLMILMTLVK